MAYLPFLCVSLEATDRSILHGKLTMEAPFGWPPCNRIVICPASTGRACEWSLSEWSSLTAFPNPVPRNLDCAHNHALRFAVSVESLPGEDGGISRHSFSVPTK